MKNKIQKISIFFLFLISNISFAQTESDSECAFLKHSQLKYIGNDTSKIIINDTIHLELVENGKFFIKSKLEWLNGCEYNATVIDFNWPKFRFPLGEVMNVKVSKTVSDTLYLDLVVRNKNYKGKYIIIN